MMYIQVSNLLYQKRAFSECIILAFTNLTILHLINYCILLENNQLEYYRIIFLSNSGIYINTCMM